MQGKLVNARWLLALLLSAFACAAFGATLSATNGILTVSIESTSGQFTITTGASHPKPNQTVFYPIGTSYFTIHDVTHTTNWTNDGAQTGNAPGYTGASLNSAPASSVTSALGTTGFRTVYTTPNFVATQDVVITGTSLADTNVRQTVTVQNTSGAPLTYGVRFMWDWMINNNDASFFRTRNPDSTFTGTFQNYQPPAFQLFEEVDSLTTPSFSVYGTVMGGSLNPAPTPPDRFGYVSWSTAVSDPWDLPVSGGNVDSATVHFWGFVTPLTLAAGASSSFTEYVSTVLSAVGGAPSTALPTTIPTLQEWALFVLAGLVLASGLWARRRWH